MELSDDLRSIYELEIAIGNEVAYIAEPAGTDCPYAVIFKNALNVKAIESELNLPPTVRYWESRDPHYPIEAGYSSLESRHAVAGPIDEQPG
jgi:hypothetical protein